MFVKLFKIFTRTSKINISRQILNINDYDDDTTIYFYRIEIYTDLVLKISHSLLRFYLSFYLVTCMHAPKLLNE